MAIVAKRTARERIAQLLDGAESAGSFSTQTSAPAKGITLSVEGVGPVKLPVGAAEERKLVAVARPAMFGLGEETLTDTSVRDTWELSADQVTLGGEWDRTLARALDEVADGLDLPRGTRLRAELHALLVYGPDQFFAPHQDSEKDDQMVGTLVVSLPSVHTGGELIITHGGQSHIYRPVGRDKVGFTAFYADCVHEVRPVRTGRRVTATFNLLVSGEPDMAQTDPDEELVELLREHFNTPRSPRWSGDTRPAPNRLVVLLDHQYSERGLSSGLFKGRDVDWVARLREAADRAGCVTAVALAEIQQTVDARPSGWEDDGTYEVGDVINDEMTLGWWQVANSAAGEEISLGFEESELCAVTPIAKLKPYESQYEGYMGNYGNTVDRWYRRAALVIWPQERSFVVRAEANPSTALVELAHRLESDDDLDRVRADVRELIDLKMLRSPRDVPLLLNVAGGLEHPALAQDLLAPLDGDSLTVECASPLAGLADRYGEGWLRGLLADLFTVGPYWVPGHKEWATSTLTSFVKALPDNESRVIASELCRRLWSGFLPSIKLALTHGPHGCAQNLAVVVPAVVALFQIAGAEDVEEMVTSIATLDDGILDLEVPVARSLGAQVPAGLVQDAVRRLVALTSTPAREWGDWSIAWTGCGCGDCSRLQTFLADREAVELMWPLATTRRDHVQGRIASAELPVSCQTIRKGRPYVLRLVKQDQLHTSEAARRKQWAADLAWLRGVHDSQS